MVLLGVKKFFFSDGSLGVGGMTACFFRLGGIFTLFTLIVQVVLVL